MKRFIVGYKMYGVVEIEAETEERAEKKFKELPDRDLLNGCDMDGDSIEVYRIEEGD